MFVQRQVIRTKQMKYICNIFVTMQSKIPKKCRENLYFYKEFIKFIVEKGQKPIDL